MFLHLIKKAKKYTKDKGLIFCIKRAVRFILLLITYELTFFLQTILGFVFFLTPNNFIKIFLEAINSFIHSLSGQGFSYRSLSTEVRSAIRLLHAKPKLVIDIGGNVGNYTLEILKNVPRADVYIFEPSSTNLAILKKCFKKRSNVNIIPFAISNKISSTTLYSNLPGSGLASLTKRDLSYIGLTFECKETVKTIIFKNFYDKTLNPRIIDLVKIDIEGHELDALSGFGSALMKIRAIQFEFGGCNIDTRTYFKDFYTFFKGNNFEIYRVSPLGPIKISSYSENEECFLTTNYLCINLNLT